MSAKMITCKTCGKEIAASAKTCPECGAKNKKPIYKKPWFWAVIIVIAIVAGTSGGGEDTTTSSANSEKTATTAVQNIEYMECTVDEMMKLLNENALKAKNTYDKKYVAVTGRLSNIDSNGSYINLLPDDQWAFIGVQCYIKDKAQLEAVAELTVGDKITVKGKISDVGEVLGYSLKIDSFG